MKTIFITGSTGVVGSWLIRSGLTRGYHFISMVRAEHEPAAFDRIANVLYKLGFNVNPNKSQLRPLCGDITKTGCGNNNLLDHVKNCDLILHSAASTSFNRSDHALNKKTNIDGTQQILDIAERLKRPLVYISTAYVAGNQNGRVYETQLDQNQQFHNSYEESKFEAETLVHEWAKQTGLKTLIIRPSIITGDTQQGTIAQFNTIYDLMRVFNSISEANLKEDIRIQANAQITKNFVPVDWLVEMIWNLIENDAVGTYHLTHPEPITLEGLRQVFSRIFKLDNIHIVDEDSFKQRRASAAERMCRSALAHYQPYLNEEPTFDVSEISKILGSKYYSPPLLNEVYFNTLLIYARKMNWGKKERKSADAISIPTNVTNYFDTFLMDKMHQQLLPDLRFLSACIRIRFKESNESGWVLDIRNGVLEQISTNGLKPECTYLTDYPTFYDIVAGQLVPQKAFFTKRIDIEGNMETALKVAAVLSAFFRKYPYEVNRA